MFQQILLVVDRSAIDHSLQTAFRLSQVYGSKLSLLHLATVEDAPLLLLSELNRLKPESDLKFQNASTGAVSTLIRPATKLKIIGTDSAVLNQLQGNSGKITQIVPQTQSLETTIADVAQLCKANLIIIGLSQYLNPAYADFIQAVNCPILILK